ncbi:MAG: hypothetical protein IJ794_09150 [Lachnospiraceae bacterium]|nr:hypothetical protein [Lachnospiraceae bacterium]
MKRNIHVWTIVLAAILLAGCGQKEEKLDFNLEIVSEDIPDTVAESADAPEENAVEGMPEAEVNGGDSVVEPTETEENGANEDVLSSKIGEQTLEGAVGEWGKAYADIIDQAAQEDENQENNYGWIYFDEDDVPELVIGRTGYYVSLYTYRNGTVYTLMDHWAYGAAGNTGYEFLPKKNLLRNYNTDHAGLVLYTSYMEMNDTPELVEKYYLKTAYEDENGEVLTPESDADMAAENWHLYISENGGEERAITADEMSTYLIQEEFQYIIGTMTAEQLKAQLQ